MRQLLRRAMFGFALILGASCALAADADLTPVGGERQGNADGSIPAWDGGIVTPPDGYDPNHHQIDPYATDEVLFRIDASNAAQYSAHLTDGQRALLAAHPSSWRMNVYRTRRSASFPAFVYEALERNAHTAEWSEAGKGTVLHSRITSPFPRPANGVQAISNHTLRFRALRVQRVDGSAAVTARGRYELVTVLQDLAFPYAVTAERLPREFDNVLFVAKSKALLPSPVTGQGTLLYETIDQTRDPRKVWRYLPSVRQLLRQPNYAYAIPAPQSDALRTVDDFDLFSGATDHFTWTLHGKREIYVPYNAYRVHDGTITTEQIVGAAHVNPELLRYELHRVWVVEANLKPNMRHIYGRRMFYLDEDSWQIALSDSWDPAGALFRTAEAHAVNYYEVPVLWTTLYVYYDLRKRRYFVEGLDNERAPYRFLSTADPREFSPNALSYYVR